MTLPSSQNTPSWHHLSIAEAFAESASTGDGLDPQEAARRFQRHGPNALPDAPPTPFWKRIIHQFQNVLIYVLLVAAALSTLLGHTADALVILGVCVINALIGLIQEGKANRALESIKHMIDPRAIVIRDGERFSIPATELVVGDHIHLEAGDKVPADVRFLEVSHLQTDDAVLTGESQITEKTVDPVPIEAPLGDRRSMGYWGTLVVTGHAKALVVATGSATELGRISTLIRNVQSLKTPLIQKMDELASRLTLGIIGLALVTFLFAWLLRGYTFDDAFMAIVGLAVAAIPEGLPAIMTITLAIGVQTMARHAAIIRKLPAVETLGSVTVICSDKTGTLTMNEMMVKTLWMNGTRIEITGSGYAPIGEFQVAGHPLEMAQQHQLTNMLKGLVLNNDAVLRPHGDSWQVEGDPMEAALLSAALKAGLDPTELKSQEPRIDDIPFDSSYKYMATRHQVGNDVFTLVKGAPEAILSRCSYQQTQSGIQPLDDHWSNYADQLASEGQRVLALAVIEGPELDAALTHLAVENNLVLLGLIGLIDPPRPDARESIALCHQARIRTVMITGDHALTAQTIARALGLAEHPSVTTGSEIDACDDVALRALVQTTDVFARTTPEHKLRIVAALQFLGEIVSMTGDGVNDAPALKRADVGVAMGLKGTEAAKEASEMILADDRFATIAIAVREGRTVYNNLRNVITWTLPTNGAEAMIIVMAILFGIPLPITPIQILWINMITAVALGLTMAFDPAPSGIMQRPPRTPGAPVLSPTLLWQIAFVSTITVLANFGIFQWALSAGHSLEVARTLVVNTLVLIEIIYLIHVRATEGQQQPRIELTRAVVIGILSVVIAQVLYTYLPVLQQLFESTPLTNELLIAPLLVAAIVGVLMQLEYRIRGSRARSHCSPLT
jgi:magnesium-transporting ATPase (P-type)